MKLTLSIASIAISLMALSGAASADLIVNGDFQLSGSTGWTVFHTHWQQDADGITKYLCLNPLSGITAPGYAEQAVATTVGTTYELKFDFGAVPKWDNYDWTMYLTIGGGTPLTYVINTGTGYQAAGPNIPWDRDLTVQFVATGSSTAIHFASAAMPTAGFYGPTIDNVSVTEAPIPEPATMSLLAIGGLAALIRRRRK